MAQWPKGSRYTLVAYHFQKENKPPARVLKTEQSALKHRIKYHSAPNMQRGKFAMSIAANFLWFPITIFLVIFLTLTLFTLIKFSSLRNYRKKRNWLFFALVILVVVLAGYLVNEDLIGPEIISYNTQVDENTFYADQINQFDVACANLGRRATNFNLVIRAVNASLIMDSSQDCNQINSTLVKIPFTLQTPAETQNITIHFTIDQNVTTFDFYFADESQAYVMNSYRQLHSVWNSTSFRFDAYPVYAPA